MRPLELPIFFHTTETTKAKAMNLDYDPPRDCQIKHMTFYNINAAEPYKFDEDDVEEYCEIHTNSTTFICKLTYSEVNEKIRESLLS